MNAKRTIAVLTAALMPLALSSYALAQDGEKLEGAKGLFFEQLQKPSEKINTGVQYWIELKRGSQVLKTSNKQNFQANDHIRFHVKANIDGYAYILLKSGSRGEQSVLFPDPKSAEDNQVARGQDYVLPSEGWLTFDENPGTEQVTLLVSRTPIDATAYLNSTGQEVTLIASASTGSKDLVPSTIQIAYQPIAAKVEAAPPARQTAVEPKTTKTSNAKVNKKTNGSGSSTSTKRHQQSHGTTAVAAKPAKNDEGVTTVVSTTPKNILHVDVALQHN